MYYSLDEVVDEDDDDSDDDDDDDNTEPIDHCIYAYCDPGVCINIPDGYFYCNCTGTEAVQSVTGTSCCK